MVMILFSLSIFHSLSPNFRVKKHLRWYVGRSMDPQFRSSTGEEEGMWRRAQIIPRHAFDSSKRQLCPSLLLRLFFSLSTLSLPAFFLVFLLHCRLRFETAMTGLEAHNGSGDAIIVPNMKASAPDSFVRVLVENLYVIAGPVVALVYPMYAIRAIETRSGVDDQQLLTYWVLFTLWLLFLSTYVGTYDEHGGTKTSRFINEHLFQHLKS